MPSLPNVGPLELVIVIVVAALVLGPKRLPGAAREAGRSFRRGRELHDEVVGGVSAPASGDRPRGADGTEASR